MSDIAIRVQNLSKLYRIGAPQARYRTLRDTLADLVRVPRILRKSNSSHSSNSWQKKDDTIWALKDVSFDVHCGETGTCFDVQDVLNTNVARIGCREAGW